MYNKVWYLACIGSPHGINFQEERIKFFIKRGLRDRLGIGQCGKNTGNY
ncbi:hypothetical protein AGMMS50256_37390 [Betaproteobacteria bacterium]|nr:hypothetical protein AGMMS50256_37390 [Betaproteobacteria bacterium]